MQKKIFIVYIITMFLFSVSACNKNSDLGKFSPENEVSGTHISSTGIALNEVFDLFSLSKEEIAKKLGNDYEIGSGGEEANLEAYIYKQLGITISFYENGTVESVFGHPSFEVHGARAGMNFSQIQEKLGKSDIQDVTLEETPEKAYYLEYTMEKYRLVFMSNDEDGRDSSLTISILE